jgi:hypothetical protein
VIFFALVSVAVVVVVLAAAAMSLFLPRHSDNERPRPGWVATDEVFRDPGTERVMRVWADRTGGRHHIPDISNGPVTNG